MSLNQYSADDAIPQHISPEDIIIAVMGITGSGKSTFISTCTEMPVEVGHGLESCTSTVSMHSFNFNDQIVRLIDSPGFNDTYRSDSEVLNEIAYWLSKAYASDVKLSGIVYLHPISCNRMQGSAIKNLTMFKKLCGDQCLPCIVLATTMWSKVSEEEGRARQNQLISTPGYWGQMLSRGSKVFKYSGSRTGALAIIGYIIDKKQKIVLDIQRQMMEQNRKVNETEAGKEIESALIKEREKFTRRMEECTKEMERALKEKDRHNEELLLQDQHRYKQQLEATNKALHDIRIDMQQLHRREEQKFEEELEHLKLQRKRDQERLEEQSRELQRLSSRLDEATDQSRKQALWPMQMNDVANMLVRNDANAMQSIMAFEDHKRKERALRIAKKAMVFGGVSASAAAGTLLCVVM